MEIIFSYIYIFFLLLQINNSDKFKLMTKEKRSHMMHIYTTVLCFVQSYLIQSSLAIWIGSSETELKYNIFILSDNIWYVPLRLNNQCKTYKYICRYYILHKVIYTMIYYSTHINLMRNSLFYVDPQMSSKTCIVIQFWLYLQSIFQFIKCI